MFTNGTIHDVVVRTLAKHIDDRGWLAELFRQDEVAAEFIPVMGYVSMTAAGVTRGPHEHADQADCFAFLGPSNFKIWLWDNRKASPTFMTRQIVYAGEDAPRSVIIPRGVVHAYTNIGAQKGMVLNFPNRLYAGDGKKSPVDEIRHESDPKSLFRLE
ncbi:MAG TPA: dTDP-4-dehydrorhamnose 3,5-epimerase family protein [Bacteroidota bacterium]|nr:dTDP-4-dehydrorhamnose 3,5-epimerase family protein [Bacteroidota bacterium]